MAAPEQLFNVRERKRFERHDIWERITANGTISAAVMVFAAIAARFDNDGDKTAAKFSDIANHWAKDEISIAYNNDWITGYPDGTFGPQRDITRAETMTLVNRVLNRQPETEDDLLPNMTVWTDNANPKAWSYLAVQQATNPHYYAFPPTSPSSPSPPLPETRDWKALEQ